MGCFGPRLTEEEKYEILKKQEERTVKITSELINSAKDSEKRVAIAKRLVKINKHLKGNKYER